MAERYVHLQGRIVVRLADHHDACHEGGLQGAATCAREVLRSLEGDCVSVGVRFQDLSVVRVESLAHGDES